MGSNGAAPAVGAAEISCQSQLGGVITTGGGFSTYYEMPSWQKDAVDYYFKSVSTQPASGYNPNGRAYPDIAYCGVDYQVVIGGLIFSIYGTSASAPVFAGMVTLINSIRLANGRPMIGFLNPTLYSVGYNNTVGLPNQYGANATFNDITSGHNSCCFYNGATPSKAPCCNSGFYAATGWDPVTGWGSMNLPDFAQIFEVASPYTPTNSNSNGKSSSDVLAIAVTLVILVVAIVSACGIVYFCCCRPKPPVPQQQPAYAPSSTSRSSSRSVNQPVPAVAVQIATPVVQVQSQYQQNPVYIPRGNT
jgi:tripeptidyl-peptidase-1